MRKGEIEKLYIYIYVLCILSSFFFLFSFFFFLLLLLLLLLLSWRLLVDRSCHPSISVRYPGGAGVGGHTLLNMLLGHLSPELISTSLLAEPLVGSLIGYFVGAQGLPGIWTVLGGGVLLLGLVATVYGDENYDIDIDTREANKRDETYGAVEQEG